MRIMKPVPTLVLLGLFGGALALEVACTNVSLYERPCPCVDGYICCDDVCELGGCSGKKRATSAADDDDDSVSAGSDDAIAQLTQQKVTPKCITADPTTVFWMNADGSVQAGSTISKANVRSRLGVAAAKVETCSLLRSGDGLYAAAAEANAIHWFSVSSDGATPVIGERTFRFATFNDPVSIVQDATYLYVLDGATGQVRRLTKLDTEGSSLDGGGGSISDGGGIPDGGTVASAGTLLGTGETKAYSLILSGEMLYWMDSAGLRRMPKTGGPITTLATLSSSAISRRAHDLQATADALYWISPPGTLMTVPIAGGVAHELPFTPVQFLPDSGSPSASSAKSVEREDGPFLDALTVSERGLILGHRTTVGLLGFQGGKELALFRYRSPRTSTISDGDPGMTSLVFDTSRFIWISGDNLAIRYRPLLETDPRVVSQ